MNESRQLAFHPGRDDLGRRIDRILRKFIPSCPLGAVYAALRKKDIRVNGLKVSPDYKVAPGDKITVSDHFARKWGIAREEGKLKSPGDASPALPSAGILLENQDLLVLDKPAGVLIHGSGSLDEAVLEYLSPKLPPSLSFTPGPLHRLDRNTSGAVFFGKSLRGAQIFTELLRQGRIVKTYVALIEGVIQKPEVWTDRIYRDEDRRISTAGGVDVGAGGADLGAGGGSAGKSASLSVKSLAVSSLAASRELSLAQFTLHTGRTHQIRVQSSARGIPLAGDVKYGGRPLGDLSITGTGLPQYLLHAALVRLADREGARALGVETVTAPLPDYFRRFVEDCFGTGTAEFLYDPST